ncbi:hypothetical protein DRJ48_01735, partial [Candidatus Woesearchaeota archaeon]
MNRNGAVEIQFNWIFVLVAGALIIAMVTGFALRWIKTSERSEAVEALSNIDTIITATGVVEGETKVVSLPDFSLRYDCNELGYSGVSVGGLRVANLFSPPELKGNSLVMWTRAWFVPFYVGNFVYITTPQVKYNVVYQPGNPSSERLLRMLEDSLPDKVNVDFVSSIGEVK